MSVTHPTFFRSAVVDGQRVDLQVADGRIAAVGPDLVAPSDAVVEDLAGAVVVPGLVDAHAHPDKTMWGGPWVPHSAPPGLSGKIHNGRVRRPELGIPSVEHITALLTDMVTLGTTHVRAHVDVDPDVGLGSVEAVRQSVADLDGRITAELVAFPQTGMLISPGTAELMEAALALGVERVGGIDPAGLDRDPVRHLDVIFAMAERHGAGVDIHLHDGGSLGIFQYELIIERTKALGLAGKVTISHGFALSDADAASRGRLIEGLAEAGISLTTVAPTKVLPLKELAAAGVPVGLGNDGIRDLWSPWGTGDMVERAMFQAMNSGFSRDEDIELALDAATYGGARVCGLDHYGLAVGDRADFVAIPGRNAAEVVALRPTRSLVVKDGRVVARDGRLV